MPSASVDADPSSFAVRSVAVAVTTAVGAMLTGAAFTVTSCCVRFVAPRSSVTVSVTG